MGVSLGFYREVEVAAGHPHVRSPVIGVCSLRLGVDFGWQDLSQIGQQGVSARVFGFRLTGALVLIDVPILAPVVGVCGPYPACDFIHPIGNQCGEIAGVDGWAVAQRTADLRGAGVSIAGVAPEYALPVSSPI